jgi:hypothetical protein
LAALKGQHPKIPTLGKTGQGWGTLGHDIFAPLKATIGEYNRLEEVEAGMSLRIKIS